MVRQWKEQHSFVGEASAPVVVSAPVDGVPTEIDITSEMRAACELIVPPIIETMMALLSQVDPEFQSRVRNNVTLAGGRALIRNLGKTLEVALDRVGGGKVTVTDHSCHSGASGHKIQVAEPPTLDEARDLLGANLRRVSGISIASHCRRH
jgi:rod shape-determining protein MreB and related proteins